MNDGDDPLKILKVAKTRWLSIYQAVDRILKQWLELKLHFELWKVKDKCYKAEILFNMYSDVKNELYLQFLKPILEEAQKANKIFQTNDNDPVKLLKSLTILIEGLTQRIVITGCQQNFLTLKVSDYLHPKPYLGFLFEDKMREYRISKKVSVDDEIYIRRTCINFLVNLITQLQQRLPDNVEILENVSLLAPENCLRTSKSSIVPLAQLMKECPEKISKIEFQWSKISFIEWINTFWMEVFHYKDSAGENPFLDLANFAKRCLVLPWSNGEVERTFSQMKIVKSPHRNNLHDLTLVAILTIRAGLRRLNKCCFEYEFPKDVLSQIGTSAAYSKAVNGSATSTCEDTSNLIAFDPILQDLIPFEEEHAA